MAMEIETLPSTQSRIAQHTPDLINEEIERQIEANVNYFKGKDRETIQQRVIELEKEWDAERILEVNLASIAFTSSILGIISNKKWMYLSGAASLFMIQQAVQGWCPPLPLLRKMGARTGNEISLEKQALKNLLDETK
ncbi:DUF2892 domain-containing protein [Planococcus sp. 1R117A]|uniref:DUF2892 domain-containing protein n=1 Tax=Planococcus sp. 1R117A TaxID=3447020 RepID=UPI003EDB9226